MDKLRECPFCGEHATEIATCMQLEECAHFEECPAAEPYVCMVCSIDKGGCGASTGYYDSAEKAVVAWNRRAQPENEPLTRCENCNHWDKSISFMSAHACAYWSPSRSSPRYTQEFDFCSFVEAKPERSEG